VTFLAGSLARSTSIGRLGPLARRVLLGAISLAIVVVIVFSLAEAGSPTAIALKNLPAGARSHAAIEIYIRTHGLDRSLPLRLETFVSALLHGNLGRTGEGTSVGSAVMPAFWKTVAIVVPAFLITVLLAVAIGAFLAEHAGGRVDRVVTALLAVGDALPAFVIGIAVLFAFAAKLGWFEISSQLAVSYGSTTTRLKAYVLPIATLVLLQWPYAAKLCRSAFADVLDTPMARAAVLRGLSPRVVRWRCVLPNTASLLAHSFGLMAATMVAGSLIIENIFSFPGIGRLSVESISTGDQPTLVGIVVVTSLWLITVSTLTDLLAVWLNPKLRAP
jgi:ABC-type dipeptide/oligopeptide/nickel transport system permease component